jgi:multidrug efflux pump subunit AcrA (membrane-fusion protein)
LRNESIIGAALAHKCGGVTKQPVSTNKRSAVAITFAAAIVVATGFLVFGCRRQPAEANASRESSANSPQPAPTVELSSSQLPAIKVQPVGSYLFYVEKKGVGNIDFNNKLYFDSSLSVQVFPPRPGRITQTIAELGDQVQKGQPLYTIDSSDKRLVEVLSPITGQVTAVNASPGLEVQPGRPPAPYAVADVSTKWMVGNVAESDSPLFQLGQRVEVRTMAFSSRVFEGAIIRIYPAVDTNTHRVMIRSQISDPENELRSGMLAEFTVRVQEPTEATAVPAKAVVREPDGTITAWVTTDRHHFSQKVIKTGLRQDERVQVLEGLNRGELVVTDGAVFLSNMLQAPPSD